MFDAIDPIWVFSACLFFAVIAGLDAIQSLFFGSTSYRSQVNRRLEMQEGETSRIDTIVDLRRERGLSVNADWQISLIWLNRLIVQSGLRIGLYKLGMFSLIAGLGAALVCGWFFGLIGLPAGFVLGAVLLPLFVLWYLRRRRVSKFTDQFAETIDIIVRSLRAGHPVPAAIKLAARELEDPIGTEFGIVEDEITFGLDLESAMRNMHQRVGQDDLPLFIASIAIQTSSGGNFTEILHNLGNVIRLRVKMRRKIKAISAEGRISAIILSITPLALFLIINAANPAFYGEIWSDPRVTYALGGAMGWMTIGNLFMRKMINFKF